MKKYDKDLDYSYACGTTLTIELLKNKKEFVKKIYFRSSYIKNESYQIINKLINNTNIEIIENDKIFTKLNSKENTFVITEFFKYKSSLDQGNHIVLVNPENEGNLGTILRSCLGFGILNIAIIKPGVDVFNPNVIRSSMGSIFRLNIQYFESFIEYSNKYCNYLYPFMLDGKENLTNFSFLEPFSLIFGPESSGLEKEYSKIGQTIKIVHSSHIDSLNLPIALSIGLYEVTKNKYLK